MQHVGNVEGACCEHQRTLLLTRIRVYAKCQRTRQPKPHQPLNLNRNVPVKIDNMEQQQSRNWTGQQELIRSLYTYAQPARVRVEAVAIEEFGVLVDQTGAGGGAGHRRHCVRRLVVAAARLHTAK